MKSKLNTSYVIRNWKKGLVTFLPILLTAWALYKMTFWVIGGYLGLTEGMAETVVFEILDLHPNDGWQTWSVLSVFHFLFMFGVLLGLFVLAEIVTERNQELIEGFVARILSRIPPGGILYKFFKLILKMLGGHEGDTALITSVCLIWQRDGAGHISFRPGYIVGDGEEKMLSDEHNGDTLITVYFGHTPNPSSGNGAFFRKAQVILTDVPLGEFATQNAMLGHGLCDRFQPYAQGLFATLRKQDFELYGDNQPVPPFNGRTKAD